MKIRNLLFVSILICISISISAQSELDEKAMIYKFKGFQYATTDSSFYINFRFRMQNRLGVFTKTGSDFEVNEVEARVRRLRMRFDGFIISDALSYSIQLSFARADTDFENTGFTNIIRDAVIFYRFSPKFYVAFGQNKLPGNRQRVNSSGQLQFADRSLVNATFNIDRDFGFKFYYTDKVGFLLYNLKAAISTGEGRSANSTDNGLAYTGRIELLPFGEFKGGGDFSEGDLEREETPKLSIAAGYSYNHKARRTAGQLGKELFAARTFGTFISDYLLKYNGWSYSGEFLLRNVTDPVTISTMGDSRYVYKGYGINQQISYVFKSDLELAARYSKIVPADEIEQFELPTNITELGATRYINNHRVKLQTSVQYINRVNNFSLNNLNRWALTFQFELGI
ncbi:MAG: porin [Saprospiraceae bacterium]|nr:porin [Saprospiraceae bacterium]